jgi:iron complex outermembrane receptor protein
VLNLSVPLFIPGFAAAPGYTRNFEVGGRQKVVAKAVFGEATLDLTARLSVTAGIRYNEERKRLFNRFLVDFFTPYTGDFLDSSAPPTVGLPPRTFKSTTPKIGIQFQVDPKTMLYASYTKGFKSGGFAAGAPDELAAAGFDPEKVDAFEAGLRTTVLDNRLRFNLTGFHYGYDDLQVQLAVGNNLVTANAASAEIYGAEVELTAVISPEFTIDGSASWLHARYGRYVGADNNTPFLPSADFSGKRLNNAPDLQSNVSATYRRSVLHGELRFKGEVEYSSKFFFSPTNVPIAGQGAFAKGHVSVIYESPEGWHVRAFGRNITDRTTRTSAFTASTLFGTPVSGALAPPRTYGIELGTKF